MGGMNPMMNPMMLMMMQQMQQMQKQGACGACGACGAATASSSKSERANDPRPTFEPDDDDAIDPDVQELCVPWNSVGLGCSTLLVGLNSQAMFSVLW